MKLIKLLILLGLLGFLGGCVSNIGTSAQGTQQKSVGVDATIGPVAVAVSLSYTTKGDGSSETHFGVERQKAASGEASGGAGTVEP